MLHIHDTTQYNGGDPSGYGLSDPSGIAYVPGLNVIFIADSEHDESPFDGPDEPIRGSAERRLPSAPTA